MPKIKCPNCGSDIELDKSNYDALLNEATKDEINNRVNEKVKLIEEKYRSELSLATSKIKNQKEMNEAELNRKIAVLNEQIKNNENLTELAVKKALEIKESELNNKTLELERLKNQLSNKDNETKLAVNVALEKSKEDLSNKEKELIFLKAQIENVKKDHQLQLDQLKNQYDFNLKVKDDEIERYKNYRLGDSTKDLGESLEQYCSDAFNEIRATSYPRSYFEKDTISDETGKGDFIFRDYTESGVEFVSIMFEMKTEKDTTKTKHKNSDFLEKLDANRKSKKCEYAVLVSTLEADSDLYNKGIVNVGYKYPKMYVIRPQHFLTLIALIRDNALNNVNYMVELDAYKKENIDITNFQEKINAIADKINYDYDKASAIYAEVDKMCDDVIKKVEKFRDEFKSAANWINKAKNQLPNLEIKSLTKNNPTMKEKFAELEEKDK